MVRYGVDLSLFAMLHAFYLYDRWNANLDYAVTCRDQPINILVFCPFQTSPLAIQQLGDYPAWATSAP